MLGFGRKEICVKNGILAALNPTYEEKASGVIQMSRGEAPKLMQDRILTPASPLPLKFMDDDRMQK